jgi:hypothetical protein
MVYFEAAKIMGLCMMYDLKMYDLGLSFSKPNQPF